MKPNDDGLEPLPPIDGDEDAADDAGEGDDIDLTIPAEPEGPADDTAAEDLDAGDAVAADDAAVNPADDAWDGDTGEPDLVGEDGAPLGPGDDDPGISESEVRIDSDEPDAGEQVGDEDGPPDAADPVLGEDLPAIDGDDEGDFEGELLGELSPEPEAAQDRVSYLVERCAHALPLPAEAIALVDPVGFDHVLVVTARDGVRRVDVRGHAEPRNLWRELLGASRFFQGDDRPCAALGPDGVLWLATPSGRLLRGEDQGATWEDIGPAPPGTRALCACSERTLLAICVDRAELCLTRSADGRSWTARPLPLPAAPYREGTVWMAKSGDAVAFGHDRATVIVSRDDGRTLETIDVACSAAGVFIEGGTLVVACRDDASESVRLVRTTVDGSIDVAAEIAVPAGDDDEDAALPAVSLAWDDPHCLLWVVAAGRLTAWGRRELQ